MQSDKEFVLDAMQRIGKTIAQNIQSRAAEMTGTELYAEEDYIPDFQAARAIQNMMTRNAGREKGFVCRSTAGRVVRLIQNYDSDERPGEPETLPAQWGFVWSDDPKKAQDFVSLSTSPYMENNCTIDAGYVWRSKIDNNVWVPSSYEQGWEKLGTVEEIMGEGTA